MALVEGKLSIWSSLALNLQERGHKITGVGGFSIVDIGAFGRTGPLVAAKHSRLLAQPLAPNAETNFDRHFMQLVLELRILSHQGLAQHPNIVSLRGLLVDEAIEQPLLSLILEYSADGDLCTF